MREGDVRALARQALRHHLDARALRVLVDLLEVHRRHELALDRRVLRLGHLLGLAHGGQRQTVARHVVAHAELHGGLGSLELRRRHGRVVQRRHCQHVLHAARRRRRPAGLRARVHVAVLAHGLRVQHVAHAQVRGGLRHAREGRGRLDRREGVAVGVGEQHVHLVLRVGLQARHRHAALGAGVRHHHGRQAGGGRGDHHQLGDLVARLGLLVVLERDRRRRDGLHGHDGRQRRALHRLEGAHGAGRVHGVGGLVAEGVRGEGDGVGGVGHGGHGHLHDSAVDAHRRGGGGHLDLVLREVRGREHHVAAARRHLLAELHQHGGGAALAACTEARHVRGLRHQTQHLLLAERGAAERVGHGALRDGDDGVAVAVVEEADLEGVDALLLRRLPVEDLAVLAGQHRHVQDHSGHCPARPEGDVLVAVLRRPLRGQRRLHALRGLEHHGRLHGLVAEAVGGHGGVLGHREGEGRQRHGALARDLAVAGARVQTHVRQHGVGGVLQHQLLAVQVDVLRRLHQHLARQLVAQQALLEAQHRAQCQRIGHHHVVCQAVARVVVDVLRHEAHPELAGHLAQRAELHVVHAHQLRGVVRRGHAQELQVAAPLQRRQRQARHWAVREHRRHQHLLLLQRRARRGQRGRRVLQQQLQRRLRVGVAHRVVHSVGGQRQREGHQQVVHVRALEHGGQLPGAARLVRLQALDRRHAHLGRRHVDRLLRQLGLHGAVRLQQHLHAHVMVHVLRGRVEAHHHRREVDGHLVHHGQAGGLHRVLARLQRRHHRRLGARHARLDAHEGHHQLLLLPLLLVAQHHVVARHLEERRGREHRLAEEAAEGHLARADHRRHVAQRHRVHRVPHAVHHERGRLLALVAAHDRALQERQRPRALHGGLQQHH